MPIDRALMSVSPAQNDIAGMPGAFALLDHLHDAAVLEDEIVRRHLRLRIASQSSAPSSDGIPV